MLEALVMRGVAMLGRPEKIGVVTLGVAARWKVGVLWGSVEGPGGP